MSKAPRPPVAVLAALCARLPLAAALVAAGCSSQRIAGDDQPTLATLAARPVQVAPDPGIASDETRAMAAYRSFLDSAKNAPQRPAAMRRLADLEIERAERRSADGGAAPDYRDAIAQYRELLRKYPQGEGNDRVLYQLARAEEQSGALETALATLTRLVAEYPASVHRDEAQFRRGELLFATRDYVAAGEAYASVLRGAADSPFSERALYMRGWSLFKQGRLEDALQPFFGVLDLRLGRAAAAAAGAPDMRNGTTDDGFTRAERELLDDTHRVMSIALANLQGAASIAPYITSERRRGYEYRVYEELAALYLKQERVKDAADTLALFARERPLHARAPQMLSRVIEILERNGFATLALDAKKDFVVRYGRTSELRAADAQGWAAAQPLVRTHLAELARHYHAEAQRTRARDAVQQAVHWYREVLAASAADAEAARNQFLLAELLFEDGQFADAASSYEKVAYEYPENGRGADAGYAALLAYERLAKAAADSAARAALQRDAVASAQRFTERYGSDARAASVGANGAQTLLALGEPERASAMARRALKPDAGNADKRTAWTVIGVADFGAGRFAASEAAYGEALALAPERSALADDLAERRAVAIYKQAETARDAGRAREAIAHFERVAQLAPRSAVRASAQFDAATALLGLGDWAAASAALEDFRRRHAGHALQAEVPAKLALAYGEQKRWAAAAGEYERIAASAGEPELRRSALWRAAELQYKAVADGAPRAAAIKAYERYLQAWPAPLAPALEARWQLARLAKDDGQSARALTWMRQLRELEAKGGAARNERTRTLSALAALRLAEPQLEAYRKVALVEPLARNLKLKKAKMEEVLAAYAQASQDGSAEAVTAATFRSAALYQDFGKALLASQRPHGLKKLELEQYNVMLEEQAFPFEEKAIALHETNARRTRQGVWDEWVKKSFDALAALEPVRYGKLERSEEAIDAIR